MFKIKASDLCSALDSASFGGGKGFVLMVSPVKQDIGNGTLMQFASVSSSDGDKTGSSNVIIQTEDMEENAIYYVSSSLRPAAITLSKITEVICIEPKEKHLVLSDEKKGSLVKCELMEKDTILEIPESPEDTIIFTIEKDIFVDLIKFGGYSATESNVAGHDQIGFQILEGETNKIVALSNRGTMTCKAVAPLCAVQKMCEDDKSGQEGQIPWHMVNYKFIRNLVAKLSGDMIQVAFTPKFMVVMTQFAVFGCKKSTGSISKALTSAYENIEYDYSAKLDKKDLLLGLEIATAGVEGKHIAIETNDDGTLNISSNEGNKTSILQKEYEGKLEQKGFLTEFLMLLLKGCGDKLHYFGKNANPDSKVPAEKFPFIVFDGKESYTFLDVNNEKTEKTIEYMSLLAPVNMKKTAK